MSAIEIPRTRAAYSQLLRGYFPFFLRAVFEHLNPAETLDWNWHIDAMCHALDRVRRGQDLRLIINVPPRHLKSITVSVAYVAWAMGHDPTQKFIVASYGGDLALRLSRDFRRVVTSGWFSAAFPEFQLARSAEGDIATTQGGYRTATSVNGAVTGTGADCIIVDDLLKAQDALSPAALDTAFEFYQGSLTSRLNSQITGKIIVIAQRIHENDVPGRCLETGLFAHLNLPGIAQKDETIATGFGKAHERKVGDVLFPARFPRETLERLKIEWGTRNFNAQILQDPVAGDGGFIQWSDISRYDVPPKRRELEKVVQSWDTAEADRIENDYSACTTWGFVRGRWLLLDVRRVKKPLRELIALVRAHRDKWKADVLLIEEAGSGRHALEMLRHEIRTMGEDEDPSWSLRRCKAAVSKIERWNAAAALLQESFALFPVEADWLDELRREVTGFPNSKHDDQVDSISQFLNFALTSRTGTTLIREALHGADERQREMAQDTFWADDELDDIAYWLRHLR